MTDPYEEALTKPLPALTAERLRIIEGMAYEAAAPKMTAQDRLGIAVVHQLVEEIRRLRQPTDRIARWVGVSGEDHCSVCGAGYES